MLIRGAVHLRIGGKRVRQIAHLLQSLHQIVIALLLFGSLVVLLDHSRIVQPVVDVVGSVAQAAVHPQKHTPDRSAHHQTHRNRCVEAVQQAGLPFAAAGQTPIAAEQIQLLVCTKHGSNQSLGTAEPVVQPLAVRQGAERTAFGQMAHFQPQTADTRQTHLEIIIRAAGVIHIGQRAARAACRVELRVPETSRVISVPKSTVPGSLKIRLRLE